MGKADYKTLLQIIEQVHLAEKDISHFIQYSPMEETHQTEDFPAFFRKLQKKMLLSKTSCYPINLYEFLQILKCPIGDWGFFNARNLQEQKIDKKIRILSDEIGMTQEAYLLMQEFVSYRELTTEPIVECMKYCLKRMQEGDERAEEDYRKFRIFLINHPIADIEDVELFVIQHLHNDRHLKRMLLECYELIPAIQRYRCPHCGWTIDHSVAGVYRCLSGDCHQSFDEQTMLTHPITKKETHRTLAEIQRTTVIPGLRELELYNRLTRRNLDVMLYPGIEKHGDLRIFLDDNRSFEVDVKNYQYPQQLAEKLVLDYKNQNIKTPYIAIPDEKAKRPYINCVNDFLAENDVNFYKLLSFKQVLQKARKEGVKDLQNI